MNSSEKLEKMDVSFCRRITKGLVEAAKNAINYRVNNIGIQITVTGTEITENNQSPDAPPPRIDCDIVCCSS